MRPIVRAVSLGVAIAAFSVSLFAAAPASASATNVGVEGSAKPVLVASGQQPLEYKEFDAKLTAEQLEQLRLAAKAAASGEVGILAQGGFDRDHWWIKISTSEIISVGAGVVCRAVFGGASWFICPPLTAAIDWALGQWPAAGGFWAELYTDGRVKVGTW